jgi:hypothetical protein
MASEDSIRRAIVRIAGGDYRRWTIGVTDEPGRRRLQHGNPRTWYYWNANTENVARRIEAYFINRGMKGATGGRGYANYIYIFTGRH